MRLVVETTRLVARGGVSRALGDCTRADGATAAGRGMSGAFDRDASSAGVAHATMSAAAASRRPRPWPTQAARGHRRIACPRDLDLDAAAVRSQRVVNAPGASRITGARQLDRAGGLAGRRAAAAPEPGHGAPASADRLAGRPPTSGPACPGRVRAQPFRLTSLGPADASLEHHAVAPGYVATSWTSRSASCRGCSAGSASPAFG